MIIEQQLRSTARLASDPATRTLADDLGRVLAGRGRRPVTAYLAGMAVARTAPEAARPPG